MDPSRPKARATATEFRKRTSSLFRRPVGIKPSAGKREHIPRTRNVIPAPLPDTMGGKHGRVNVKVVFGKLIDEVGGSERAHETRPRQSR